MIPRHFRVILRDEADLFADLHGLRAAFGAELVEEATRVGLDCVFADEELVRDLAVAETFGDERKDFEFAFGDAELSLLLFVEGERAGDWNGDLLDNLDF